MWTKIASGKLKRFEAAVPKALCTEGWGGGALIWSSGVFCKRKKEMYNSLILLCVPNVEKGR